MRAFDFTPYRRQMIGFDRLFDMLERNTNQSGAEGYPPFDIEKTDDDQFRIAIAVAGFRPEEIEITSQNATLIVTGRKAEETGQRQWLHRGIAARAFERRFELADYIVVQSADLRDGLLTIELKREVPEALKPRRIAIGGTAQPAANVNQAQPQQIEGEARQAA
jgi:molecular chaperone IbpA